ncbi:hypothetical protein BOX15_Mlig012719g2 [Macrostomum lignano]|uniref:C-type lectin domain-containing protein n=1 Tax=Macrostomum lignano TaxID=282301 RepID=A0A267EFL9_9PLAT|nr:hypothetical protein BOX15_Mlig012719g2 [Macrostomum lignano]
MANPSRLITILLALISHHQLTRLAFGLCPAPSDPPMASDDFYLGNSPSTGEDEIDSQWLEHSGFCYRYVGRRKAWYPAELVCRHWGGHLVSIRSTEENRLIGRLTRCRRVWIGRFATDLHRIGEPSSYEWTEDEAAAASSSGNGSSGAADAGFYQSCHNVSTQSMPDRHAGALLAEGLAWTNEHYHERLPFVCKTASTVHDAGRCSSPMSQFNGHCYWLSDFVTSFVDASLHCERELGGHLASVHSPAEARLIASLELDKDTCQLSTVWIGLIRQSPCRRSHAYPVRENEPCYQWTDFSGELSGYPYWANGHPLQTDDGLPTGNTAGSQDQPAWTMNCVTLSGDGLRNERCHSRRRFVCKVQQEKVHHRTDATAATSEEPGMGESRADGSSKEKKK